MLDEHHLSEAAPTAPHLAEAAAYGLPDAVVVVDHDGTVEWANPAACRMFGAVPGPGVRVAAIGFVHPDDRALCTLAVERSRTQLPATPLEIRVRGAEGWRLAEVIGADACGRLLLTIRDVTERRRTEVVADAAARCHTILQRSATVTLVVDRAGTVRHASDGLARFLGVDPAQAEGAPLAALVAPCDHAALDQAFRRLLDPADDVRELAVDLRMDSAAAPDGVVPFALTFTDLRDDPTVAGIVVAAHEITDRVKAESQLRQANSLLTATLEATDDGIFVVDRECRVTTVNSRFAEMWNIPAAVLATGNGEAVLAAASSLMRDPETVIARNLELAAEPESHGRDLVEFTDGRVFELTSLPQRIDGEVVGRVWSVRDVTERVRLEHELAHQALHDPLTGLANTVLFRDRLTRAAARLHRHSRSLAVLFIDLDCFKAVNDTLGHSSGDALLVAVGERLAGCLRTEDTAARLGGDEFAVLLDELRDPEEARLVAGRILTAIRAPLVLGLTPVSTTASIGVAYGWPGSAADELLGRADAAMYSAKTAGKDCVRVHGEA